MNPLVLIALLGGGLFIWSKSKAATAAAAAANPGQNLLAQYQAGTLSPTNPATIAAINTAGGDINALGSSIKNLLGPVAPKLNNPSTSINNSPASFSNSTAAEALDGNDSALEDESLYNPFYFGDGSADQLDPITGTLG